MLREISAVVISESIINEGKEWKVKDKDDWTKDETQRRIADKVFKGLLAYRHFEKIELRYFTWLEPGVVNEEKQERTISLAIEQLLQEYIITGSPPPSDSEADNEDAPARKTSLPPPRYTIQQATPTYSTSEMLAPFGISPRHPTRQTDAL